MKSSTMKNVKQYKGDGLRVEIDINDVNLRVSGDGCRVTISRNCGSVSVVGDGCSLKVNCNDGDIEYKGDGGSIYLGGGSKTESVSYVGDGGRISVQNEDRRARKKCDKNNKNNKNNNEKNNNRCSFSDSELEIKNRDKNVNEDCEEARRKKSDRIFTDDHRRHHQRVKDDKTNLRRSKTIVVTKISTEHMPVNINNNDNNNFIKNIFQNPQSRIIRNFKSSPKTL